LNIRAAGAETALALKTFAFVNVVRLAASINSKKIAFVKILPESFSGNFYRKLCLISRCGNMFFDFNDLREFYEMID
jgi:hypothetical protein